MPQEEIIARRYARGLAELAAAEKRMDEVRRDFALLMEILDGGEGSSGPEFAAFLASPSVPAAERRRAAAAVLERCGIGQIVGDFLGVVVRRGRVGLVPGIYEAFAEAADALTGDRTAVVRTAMPLTDDQRLRLAEALAKAAGTRVWLRQVIEPGLLAGAKVTIGDRTLDGSVRGKLDRLERSLAERALAETSKLA